MKELTEKLNAGRLYYVKKKNGKIVIRKACLFSCLKPEEAAPFVDFDDHDIEEVLAPVPSYKEVQEMKEYLDYSIKNRYQLTEQINFWMDEHSKLKEENAILKGLLRKTKNPLKYFSYIFKGKLIGGTECESDKRLKKHKELLTKIEETLK